MESSSTKDIKENEERMLRIGETVTTLPNIFFTQPEQGRDSFCGYGKIPVSSKDLTDPKTRLSKMPVLNEDIKRVCLAALPLTRGDKNKEDGKVRHRFVILLETVAGNCLSVELKQADGNGNTVVMVRPCAIELV
ncbi:uncharacterized protein PG986_002228 [Apiospora aurea]|uniref:Uncharacterized protein n=1 Tax=Apiospora aurea TaxID=335848 RepID=A0ABR1QZZ5_9PEZI